MSAARVRLCHLQMLLAMRRFGWLNTAAVAMLMLSACAWWWGVAYLQKQTHAPLDNLKKAQLQLQSQDLDNTGNMRSPLEERLAAFHHVLGDIRYAEQQIKTLFAVAGKSGLVLSQAEYKAVLDRHSGVTHFQVVLPVKGSYHAIRRFCEQTLLAIQFASLDEISFKRDMISNRTLEAKLRFTFYMGDSQPSGAAAAVEAALPVKGNQP